MSTIVTESGSPFSPDVNVLKAQDTVGDALILKCSTVLGSILGDQPAVNVGWFDGAEATYVAEADTIPTDNPTPANIEIRTGRLSVLSALSREMFEQVGTASALAESLQGSLIRAADAAFISQAAPTPPATAPSTGLANVTGAVSGAEVGASGLDELIDLRSILQSNGANPTHVLLAPDSAAEIFKLRTASGANTTLLGAAGVDAPAMTILGLPMIISSAVPSGKGLMLDKGAILSAVGSVEVSTSEHVLWAENGISVRGLWRIGFAVPKPKRLGLFDVTLPTRNPISGPGTATRRPGPLRHLEVTRCMDTQALTMWPTAWSSA
ncbi:phage major capsid protein [Ammonicoccus fulvus]|uniref:Phage major capsid protein n=1 Tax=Ammonicoccus fulvus TaxID=3138240 RepID=A0ABZ3FL80_9ACTN